MESQVTMVNHEQSDPNVSTDARLNVAFVVNSVTPYRAYVHAQIAEAFPEIHLSTLTTHDNAYNRWAGMGIPNSIHCVAFGHGEPTNEQPQFRFAAREWNKGARILRWLQSNPCDAVFCQGYGDVGRLRILRWCHRRGLPCFLTADHNIQGDNPGPLKRLLKQLVVGKAIGWSQGVMPCGEYGAALFERYGATRDQIYNFPFLPNVELLTQTPLEAISEAEAEFGLQSNRRRIVFCGRMSAIKRPDLALRVFESIAARRPDWDLLMIGEGTMRAQCEASVPVELRPRVKWLGFVNGSRRLAGILAQSDVLLHPSDKEPWGVVIVEAAAAGLAIVTTDVTGSSYELIEEASNGFVVPAGNLQALQDAMLKATDEKNLKRFKSASRQIFHQWLAKNHPVQGFRKALERCDLLPYDDGDDHRGKTEMPTLSPRKFSCEREKQEMCVRT